MEDKNSNEYDIENKEWLESFNYVLQNETPDRVNELLALLLEHAHKQGIHYKFSNNTPNINTIPVSEQLPYPGNRDIERKIKSIIRWNAMAMVVRANREEDGIGGHISTFASSATLYEVGFNHFFRGGDDGHEPDMIYIQGHAAPGIYSRSFLEGRLSLNDLENFRREMKGGIASYPHPRVMPEYWQFPSVSMGLAPIQSIYQARFNRYLEDKGLKPKSDQKIWAFLGDGEMDEPESMGAITLASREKLDNLIFVINCNLQRLDGPVRGNGQIVQELEAAFKGAGWNVIKIILGSDWDELIEKDKSGLLVKRFNEIVDGQIQRYVVAGGDYFRKDFFGKYPELLKLVEHYSDEQLNKLNRGGHDPVKVYNAYKKAFDHIGSPTLILAQTIKGYGLGEAGEGRNITHQQKKMNEDELKHFRSRFGIPISDEHVAEAPFYKPNEDSEEIKYLKQQREKLGGYLPKRKTKSEAIVMPEQKVFRTYDAGSVDHEVATTMVIVNIIFELLKDKNIGKLIVPIVPDEARTFGMDALFRQVGIYSHVGQLYEPVDHDSFLYYREATNGAILEEGISEAGAMSSFIAAATAYSTHGINTIPFFLFYSMFGLQRIGDLIWAAGDIRSRGFLIGATAGRTTLAGEGLQHCDGQSHLYAMAFPSLKAYDPAFAYELSVIVEDGLKRMYVDQEDIFYYITVMNEKYLMPTMPDNAHDGILKGMYCFKKSELTTDVKVNLLGSGTILNEAIKAAEILEKQYQIAVDVWSVTSYKELYYDALNIERWNRLHPEKQKKQTYIETCFDGKDHVFVAASDYVKATSLIVSKWFPGKFTALGTDGYGRSDGREYLREYFEVNAKHIVIAALTSLSDQNKIDKNIVIKALKEFGVNSEKQNPLDI